mgnify:CR=1 FL=1|tara:strand:- start:1258 stop:1767 length:510 start_codon:yes stop_codon:yes gene_type:complete
MGTKRVGWARIRSLINENQNEIKVRNTDILAVTTTKTLVANDSGATVYMTKNGSGYVITLPAATVGSNFKFVVAAGGAANHFLTCAGSDLIFGKAQVTSTHATHDSAVQEILKASAKDSVFLHSTGATSGGRVGDTVELTCIEAGYWICVANLYTSHATPASIVTIKND